MIVLIGTGVPDFRKNQYSIGLQYLNFPVDNLLKTPIISA
jgi:hypothetical protein